jgi:hypothetical protein
MAAPAGGDSNPVKDLMYFIGILFVIMLLWYFMGGQNSKNANSGPFLKSPIDNTSSLSTNSSYKNKVTLSSSYDGRTGDVSREYVVIEASSDNSSKINITGWKLQNKAGETVTINQGVLLPQINQQNTFGNIYLDPGDRAYISTGRSPLGFSFKINKCTGYFNQQLPFYPTLPNECPNPFNGESFPSYLDNKCLDFLSQNTQACSAYTNYPPDLSGNCRNFISDQLNYQSCVNNNSGNSNFYGHEWRVFLGRTTEMWNDEGDVVTLKDAKGIIVDSLSL